MKISVIIPVFNEENTIEEILQKVAKSPIVNEIIVVDDGSNDDSKSKIKNRKLKIENDKLEIKTVFHSKNQGKGTAIRNGIKKATGDILVIQDADLEYNPKDYSRLITAIINGEVDVVYGSRFLNKKIKIFGKGRIILPHHYIANRFLSFLTNFLYRSNLTDMETCYKVMSRKVYQGLKLKSSGFEIEPEITAKILKKGYKIKEVPISHNPRDYSQGKKITWKDGFLALFYLFKYRVVW